MWIARLGLLLYTIALIHISLSGSHHVGCIPWLQTQQSSDFSCGQFKLFQLWPVTSLSAAKYNTMCKFTPDQLGIQYSRGQLLALAHYGHNSLLPKQVLPEDIWTKVKSYGIK